MDTRTVFLKLPAEMIERIDRDNVIGDRSAFITSLLNQQLNTFSTMDVSSDFNQEIDKEKKNLISSSEININTIKGENLGRFDINSITGFEKLIKKISEISDDPIVRMRAKRLL